MKDAIYSICKHIIPLITDSTQDDIRIELPHIFTEAPNLRPGDVVIKHPINSTTEQHKATLIDITIIPPFHTNENTTDFKDVSQEITNHHKHYENKKI